MSNSSSHQSEATLLIMLPSLALEEIKERLVLDSFQLCTLHTFASEAKSAQWTFQKSYQGRTCLLAFFSQRTVKSLGAAVLETFYPKSLEDHCCDLHFLSVLFDG